MGYGLGTQVRLSMEMLGSGASSISSSREASPVACWVPSGEGLAPAAARNAELAAVAASCFFRC